MKVLVPLDGTAESETILPWARLFMDLDGAAVSFIHVTNPGAEDGCKGYVNSVLKRFPKTAFHVSGGDTAFEIIRHAREGGFDLIALRTHCRAGASRLAFGSVAAEVLEHSTVSLFVTGPTYRPAEQLQIRRILVPLDGSAFSAEILKDVKPLAKIFGASVQVFHCGQFEASVRSWANLVDARVEIAAGDPIKEILRRSENVDLIAMATHGRSGLSRLILGSVAEAVVRASSVPVLLRRPI